MEFTLGNLFLILIGFVIALVGFMAYVLWRVERIARMFSDTLLIMAGKPVKVRAKKPKKAKALTTEDNLKFVIGE